jgi:hypothetical protein
MGSPAFTVSAKLALTILKEILVNINPSVYEIATCSIILSAVKSVLLTLFSAYTFLYIVVIIEAIAN